MRTSLLLAIILSLGLFLFLAAEAREFTDTQGRIIDAEILSVDGDEVRIKRRDGKEFSIEIAKFTEPDQAFIRDWGKDKPASMPAAAPAAASGGEGPKPGETLEFEFPELEKDFKGEPASFKASVPKDYDPAKPVPLLIFLGGGTGGNTPGGAAALTKGDFVCAGLPYPDNGRNPGQANMVGEFDNIWDYWKPMLEKLTEAIPNLDPKLRVIGGFSNGGHAIDGLLGEEEFSKFFTAFFLIDGGGALGDRYKNAKDRHAYIAWGTKSPNAANSEEVVKRARRSGMKVESHPMEDVGHEFPADEKERVKNWIYETVIPGVTGGAAAGS